MEIVIGFLIAFFVGAGFYTFVIGIAYGIDSILGRKGRK